MSKSLARRRQVKSAGRDASRSPLEQPPPYRVFISYSHADRPYAQKIAEILIRNGIKPMWDKDFAFGQGFHEQIKRFIAHSHVFLPILTPEANRRKWVHEEIGYAMALNIPTVPVAIGELPEAMIQQLQAIQVEEGQIGKLSSYLTRDAIEPVVTTRAPGMEPLYACAEMPDTRATMLAGYCQDVLSLREFGTVRQKGGLSSFHIPRQTVGHGVWTRRYGRLPRSEEHCRKQRDERLALERHARVVGCKIIVNPTLKFAEYGREARRCRLECLREFLLAMPDSHCQVAVKEVMAHRESVTIVGNWFAAKSMAAEVGKGYFQTIFTRHAPTVIEALEAFDEEFEELLTEAGVRAADSRRWAIGRLDEELAAMDRKGVGRIKPRAKRSGPARPSRADSAR